MFDASAQITKKGDLEQKIINQLANKMGRKRAAIATLAEDTVSKAIEKCRKLFVPDDDEIGQLGVGKSGSPDTQKTLNAWKGMLPGAAGEVKLNFQKNASQAKFGTIQFVIDKNNFYKYRDCVYTSTRGLGGLTDESQEIEWMRHFLEGLEVKGFAYLDNAEDGFNKNRSRTGIGHMAKTTGGKIKLSGKHFKFVGTGDDKYRRLQAEIVKAFQSKKFVAQVRKIIGG